MRSNKVKRDPRSCNLLNLKYLKHIHVDARRFIVDASILFIDASLFFVDAG